MYTGCIGDTTEVGVYSSGASPSGALDMMGNASEWVDSWFGPFGSNDVYDGIPSRVQRGGSGILMKEKGILHIVIMDYPHILQMVPAFAVRWMLNNALPQTLPI